jgi:PadR family transcriptional regulator, regulatory protein PadR
MKYISKMLDRELKKGSAELLILSLVEARPRHGYEISKLIEERSRGRLRFHIASLYPLLYRLEERGWLEGRWVEKPGTRRRRFYRLTREGRKVLAAQRDNWLDFVEAVARITGLKHA